MAGWIEMQQAVREHRIVEVEHDRSDAPYPDNYSYKKGRTADVTRRRLAPFVVGETRTGEPAIRGFHVSGDTNDLDMNSFGLFRIDRIKSIKITDQKFNPNQNKFTQFRRERADDGMPTIVTHISDFPIPTDEQKTSLSGGSMGKRLRRGGNVIKGRGGRFAKR